MEVRKGLTVFELRIKGRVYGLQSDTQEILNIQDTES